MIEKTTVVKTLRFSAALHDQLKAYAEADHRSLNAEIVYVLERFVAERQAAARP